MKNYRIFELTNDNKEKYLEQVVELEVIVLDNMKREGKNGQLFITGRDDINEYIESKENSVVVTVNEKNRVVSAAYITQGQIPFTYNDITKYYKYGEKYNEYVKSLYSSDIEYKKDMIKAYQLKLNAFEYASNRILQEYKQYGSITDFLNHELEDKENNFHEKSILRDSLNKYMSNYVKDNDEENENLMLIYERFYWTNSQDISKEFNKDIDLSNLKNPIISQYENVLNLEKISENNLILEKGKLEIHEKAQFNVEDYYKANTSNSVEIDTYITDPNQRHAGLARVLVYEGIKKHIQRYFEKTEGNEIFLCSTLHRDNLSSKYVSEFFGLKDNLFVKRREGRDREVHICKIEKNKSNEYLNHMQDKLAVLYGYNPENKVISDDVQKNILEEQLEYEIKEIQRLEGIHESNCTYTGKVGSNSKSSKIQRLKERLEVINKTKENNLIEEGER